MKKLDFYIDLYHKENERGYQQTLNIPFLIISVEISSLFVLITNYKYCFVGFELLLDIIFLLFISVSFGLISCGIFFLQKAFRKVDKKGNEYKGIANIEMFEKWYINNKSKTANPKKMFDDQLNIYLVESIQHNTLVNDKKHNNLNEAKRYIINAVFFLMLAIIPYFFNYFINLDNHKENNIERINERINTIENKLINIEEMAKKQKQKKEKSVVEKPDKNKEVDKAPPMRAYKRGGLLGKPDAINEK